MAAIEELFAVAGPSSAAAPAPVQDDEAPEVIWENEKKDQLSVIFPDYSPQWLLEQVQAVRQIHGMDDRMVEQKCDQIFAMDKAAIHSSVSLLDESFFRIFCRVFRNPI